MHTEKGGKVAHAASSRIAPREGKTSQDGLKFYVSRPDPQLRNNGVGIPASRNLYKKPSPVAHKHTSSNDSLESYEAVVGSGIGLDPRRFERALRKKQDNQVRSKASTTGHGPVLQPQRVTRATSTSDLGATKKIDLQFTFDNPKDADIFKFNNVRVLRRKSSAQPSPSTVVAPSKSGVTQPPPASVSGSDLAFLANRPQALYDRLQKPRKNTAEWESLHGRGLRAGSKQFVPGNIEGPGPSPTIEKRGWQPKKVKATVNKGKPDDGRKRIRRKLGKGRRRGGRKGKKTHSP